MIIKNNKTTSALYKGTKEILKRYKGTLVVYEGFDKLIASGVPPITLQKCKKAKLLDYKIYGDTLQVGKNLIAYPYVNISNTYSGVEIIDNGDGTLTLNGTATANITFNIVNKRNSLFQGVTHNKTYTLSLNFEGTYTGNVNVTINQYIEGVSSYLSWLSANTSKPDSGVLNEKATGLRGYFYIYSGASFENTILKPQLELGDAKTEWETSVPSTENPIEIESVGEKTKNLFDEKDLLKYNVNRDYYTVDKDGVTLVRSHGSAWADLDTLVVLPAGTYSMSTTIQDVARVQIYDENNSAIVSEKVTPFSFTLTEAKKLKIKILSRTSYPIFIGHIQIEKSEVVTEYEPYGYKIPVKVSGKNLLNPSKFSGGSLVDYNGVQCYKYKDAANNFTYTDDFKENTQYSFSIRIFSEGEFKNTSFIIVYTDDTTTSVSIKDYDTVYSVTSSSDKTIKRIVGSFNWSVTRYIDLSVSQLEEGTITTTFEPYHEPITTNIYLNEPLRKIEDYVDYLDFENKKVYRNIYQEFITEIGSTSSLKGTYKIFLCIIDKTPRFVGQTGYAISNKFIQYTKGYPTLFDNGGAIQSYITSGGLNRIAITFNDTSITTIEQAQEKIGDGFDVCYLLAETLEEDVELPNILLNKGKNRIEIDTTLIPNIEIKYYGRTDVLLVNEEENIILNDILSDNTDTELDISEDAILQKLDEIIGG